MNKHEGNNKLIQKGKNNEERLTRILRTLVKRPREIYANAEE